MLNGPCCEVQLSPPSKFAGMSVCTVRGVTCNTRIQNSAGKWTPTCVPVPAGCGKVGAECCPEPNQSSIFVPGYCTDDNTACLPLDTVAVELDLPVPTEASQSSVVNVCRRFNNDACGQPGGLCIGNFSSWLLSPAPQCPSDKQQCPQG